MSSVINSTHPILALAAPASTRFLGNKACAGFPLARRCLGGQRLDLMQVLVTYLEATYFMRAGRVSMIGVENFNTNTLVASCAFRPQYKHIVTVANGDLKR